MGFVKSYGLTNLYIARIELKLVLWVEGGEVNIPTKFEENLRTLDFLCNLCIMSYILSLWF